LLRWLTAVLRPRELKRDADYFGSAPAAAAARARVLDQLAPLVAAGGLSAPAAAAPLSLAAAPAGGDGQGSGQGGAHGGAHGGGLGGRDSVACFLNLFMWVNRDAGSFDDDDAAAPPPAFAAGGGLPLFASLKEEGDGGGVFDDSPRSAEDAGAWEADDASRPVLVKGDSIAAFDALIAAALDAADPAASAAAAPAARCLLRVGEGLFAASHARHASLFRMQAAASGGLGRYDLLAALQTRVLADAAAASAAAAASVSGPSAAAAAAVARLNHRLQVLAHYLSATAAANKRPSHATRAAAGGRLLALTVCLEDAGGNGGAATAAAAADGPGGPGSAAVTLRLHGNATLQDATAAAVAALASDPHFAPAPGGAMPGTFEWRLKPVGPPPPAYALTSAQTLPKLPPFKVPQLPSAPFCRSAHRTISFFCLVPFT
jgi:hypothetical protein